MSKRYVKQHIVPKRYLDRFASNVKGKSIIGTRLNLNNKITLLDNLCFSLITSGIHSLGLGPFSV